MEYEKINTKANQAMNLREDHSKVRRTFLYLTQDQSHVDHF